MYSVLILLFFFNYELLNIIKYNNTNINLLQIFIPVIIMINLIYFNHVLKYVRFYIQI